MSYSLQDLNIDSQNPSLVVAFANLLSQVGEGINPEDLQVSLSSDNRPLNWLSLPEHFDWLHIESASDTGGWPSTNDSIVRFRVLDQGSVVDHYCLVADPQAQTIVDSYDGKIKSAGLYGNPHGWAQYTEADDVAEVPEALPPAPNTIYAWVKGDILSMVARRVGCTGKELLEHNDLENADNIAPGTILHLPYPLPDKPLRATRYDILPEPQAMHTKKDTRKYNFGNAKTWEDMNTTGFWPQHTNVTILAIAYVPLTENGKEIEAAYYLDAMSLGDYKTTGKVRYTTGYSHNDLAPGHVDKSAPAPVAEKAMALSPEQLEAKKSEVKQLVADEAAEHPDKYPNFFKSTWQPESPFKECTVILPKGQEYILVEDYDPEGHRNPVKLRQGREIFIAGTFEYGGSIYGRPAIENRDGELVVSRHWYGIPMDYLESNKELYNELEKRQLPWLERNFWVPLAKTYYGDTVQKFVIKNKKKG